MFSLLSGCVLWSSRRWILINVLQRSFGANLPRQGFAATCCAFCSVSFAWEVARESPIVNIVSQMMNKHISLSWIAWKCAQVISGKVYVAWKGKMLHDVIGRHQAYIEIHLNIWDTCRNIEIHVEIWGIWICIWLRPRMCDQIINSLCEENYVLQGKRKFDSWRSQGLTLFTSKNLQAVTLVNFMKNE